MQKAIIVDLDGTLCNCDHRLKYVHCDPKKWNEFHEAAANDVPNPWCLELIDSFIKTDHKIVLLTGRDEKYKSITKAWLKENNVHYDLLLMRPDDDRRGDNEVKWDYYQNDIAPHFDVTLVVEDRLSVVKMWREKNIPCLQCDWGDF